MTVLEPLTKLSENAITSTRYSSEHSIAWDNFVSTSKNATFLFQRNYMDYHSDRFVDHSLLFFKEQELIALFPANIVGDTLYSHGGLTYGGILSDHRMGTPTMLKIFEELNRHCQETGIKKVIYKAIPYIYHNAPSDEDLYALFRFGAKLVGRNLSSTIYLPQKRRFNKKRRESVTKAKNHGLIVKQSFDFEGFMQMVKRLINGRHKSDPAHSAAEMTLLAGRFPDNIKLFGAYQDERMLAGCLIYESKNVAHGQYAANLADGRNLGAQDLIIDFLVNSYFEKAKYFDFGISTLTMGQILNQGLVNHKESFGASAVNYDFYELAIKP